MNFDAIAESLVETGADVLDVVKPDWLDNMPEDVTVINFIDSESCPLRWAFGDFLEGDRVLWRHGYRNLGAYGFAHPAEFNSVWSNQIQTAYDAVNRAWHKLITERRKQS